MGSGTSRAHAISDATKYELEHPDEVKTAPEAKVQVKPLTSKFDNINKLDASEQKEPTGHVRDGFKIDQSDRTVMVDNREATEEPPSVVKRDDTFAGLDISENYKPEQDGGTTTESLQREATGNTMDELLQDTNVVGDQVVPPEDMETKTGEDVNGGEYKDGQQDYTQEQQDYTQEQQDYTQEQQAYSQEQQGYGDPQHDYTDPQHDYTDPQQGFPEQPHQPGSTPVQQQPTDAQVEDIPAKLTIQGNAPLDQDPFQLADLRELEKSNRDLIPMMKHSPTKRNLRTGQYDFLYPVAGTKRGESGYYTDEPNAPTWQYWNYDPESGWEMLTDGIEPFKNEDDNDSIDHMLLDIEHDAAVVEQTTNALFELFEHYGDDDTETHNLILKTIASGNVDVEAHDGNGKTLLMCACEVRDKEAVQQIARLGADLDKPNYFGVTPLHIACFESTYDVEILKYLLEHKAYPNCADSEQCTPLHYAASCGESVLVAMLLLHNSHVEKTDCRGFTPMDYAVQFGHETIVELLGAVGGVGKDDWTEYIDQKTGYPYYYNTVTRETRWYRPGSDVLHGNAVANTIIARIFREYKQNRTTRPRKQVCEENKEDDSGNVVQDESKDADAPRRASVCSISSVTSDYEGSRPTHLFGHDENGGLKPPPLLQLSPPKSPLGDLADLNLDSDLHPRSPVLMRAMTQGKVVLPPPGEVESKSEWNKLAGLQAGSSFRVAKATHDSGAEGKTSKSEKLKYEKSQYDLLILQMQAAEEDKNATESDLTALRDELEGKNKELETLMREVAEERKAAAKEREANELSLDEERKLMEEELKASQEEAAAKAREEAQRAAKEQMDQLTKELERKKQELGTVKGELTKITLKTEKLSMEEMERIKQNALKEAERVTDKKIANIKSKMDQEKQTSESLQDELARLRGEQSKTLSEMERLKELENQQNIVETQQQEMMRMMEQMRLENEKLKRAVVEEQEQRRKYFNQVEDMKGRIRVYCRIRPRNNKEKENPNQGKVVVVRSSPQMVMFTKRQTTVTGDVKKVSKPYPFDVVFGPEATQNEVFQDTKLLVQSACDGFNVCIFAYGQTGSGKTYTMLGSEDPSSSDETSLGIVPRAVKEVFALAEREQDLKEFKVQFCQVELYCNKLIDLMSDAEPFFSEVSGSEAAQQTGDAPASQGKRLSIKTNEHGRVYVENAVVKEVNSVADLNDLVAMGSEKRMTASTMMNMESSRSHLISMILIKSRNKASGVVSVGKLTLVDLAGSERVAKTGVTDEKLKEANSINQSLSALGNVISALVDRSKHVPYRNHPLTQLMSDSLGGDSKTLMIVNVSPAMYNMNETENTLAYAQRVKRVKNASPTKKVKTKEIMALKAKIDKLKAGKSG